MPRNLTHKLTNIRAKEWLADCEFCGKNIPLRTYNGKLRCGFAGRKNGQYRRFLKPFCERCGFMPEYSWLLDGHHRDGNRKNNARSNIETVCASCHRLLSFGEKHFGFKPPKYVTPKFLTVSERKAWKRKPRKARRIGLTGNSGKALDAPNFEDKESYSLAEIESMAKGMRGGYPVRRIRANRWEYESKLLRNCIR